jgi:hypothetical protein
MSHIVTSHDGVVLVHAKDAESVGFPPQTVRLLADSSSTGGKLSTQRVTLRGGVDGANPPPPRLIGRVVLCAERVSSAAGR